jgi:hypothetical protein
MNKDTLHQEIFDFAHSYFFDEHIVISKVKYNENNIIQFSNTRYAHQFLNELTSTKHRFRNEEKFKDYLFNITENVVNFSRK